MADIKSDKIHPYKKYRPLAAGLINKNQCKVAIKKANKLMNGNGRLLIRQSGTEPKIRIMGESYNKNLILKCIKMIKKSINK